MILIIWYYNYIVFKIAAFFIIYLFQIDFKWLFFKKWGRLTFSNMFDKLFFTKLKFKWLFNRKPSFFDFLFENSVPLTFQSEIKFELTSVTSLTLFVLKSSSIVFSIKNQISMNFLSKIIFSNFSIRNQITLLWLLNNKLSTRDLLIKNAFKWLSLRNINYQETFHSKN